MCELDAVSAILLEVEDECGGQEVWERIENDNGFLVNLLDGTLEFVTVSI